MSSSGEWVGPLVSGWGFHWVGGASSEWMHRLTEFLHALMVDGSSGGCGVQYSRPPMSHTTSDSLVCDPSPPTPFSLLVSVMEDSQNSVAVAVACHDVGEYVRHNPRGKR